ncbi:MAG TPA: HAD-IG family 5'-nucleotidase [Anaeromyxobacteraceae bacterium]|jgi:HAD superfamily 5'-nucleotidase-like hydrolase
MGERGNGAGESYADPAVRALLSERPAAREVPRGRQVFVNRNLRMDRIEAVGFDMDYTLATYRVGPAEELAFGLTRDRMVERLGYPASLRDAAWDADFVIRGLVMDKQTGNIFKMDRHNHVGRCTHGSRPLPPEEIRRLYREEKIHLSYPRFAWLDSYFTLPEASIFAAAVDRMEAAGMAVDYVRLYEDIRTTIDEVHADGSLKDLVRADLPRFVQRDPELGPALHKLRSGGKKLFLLTNSAADYTDGVMRHALDGVLPEYPSWRNYFEFVVTSARKPSFFAERRPIEELGPGGEVLGEARTLERGRTYQGGCLAELERLAGFGGERVLYVGDHIYGDILRSRRDSLWRTCMIVEELERELAWLERNRAALEETARLEELRARIGDALSARRALLNSLDRRLDREDPEAEERERLEADRRRAKQELDLMRRAHRDADRRIAALEDAVERGFNRHWGLTFKEGHENSRFGEQIEDYACVYTSRVSNFLLYSPMEYFRSPRAAMPHERAGVALAPFGDEHGLPRAGARPSRAAKP